ncbi:unnamed protein product [Lactuca virosa]|uniref:Uncharacterized protein n=1 Tax=Lactuca virosa TaxID=75947 RepID=A0AAU9PAZ5_9ASTR|nr:unnamed protein product [Lactuca virosa]
MKVGPGGASSGAIRGTSLQMAGVNTPIANASTVTRIQNLKCFGETPQVTIVVRHQNVTTGGVVEEGRTSQQSKMVEEWEIDKLEAFKTFKDMNNMRMLQKEKQPYKEKEWDQVYVHTDQTKDSNEEEDEVMEREKRRRDLAMQNSEKTLKRTKENPWKW